MIVVVVTDEILDGVFREKVLELAVQLGGQGFVMGDDECGPLHGGNDVGDGKGFPRTGYPQKDLMRIPIFQDRPTRRSMAWG